MAKNRRERIPLTQGSGFYDLQLSDSGIVKVEFDSKEKELVVTPLRIGHVSFQLENQNLSVNISNF